MIELQFEGVDAVLAELGVVVDLAVELGIVHFDYTNCQDIILDNEQFELLLQTHLPDPGQDLLPGHFREVEFVSLGQGGLLVLGVGFGGPEGLQVVLLDTTLLLAVHLLHTLDVLEGRDETYVGGLLSQEFTERSYDLVPLTFLFHDDILRL